MAQYTFLCGNCGKELAIEQYVATGADRVRCPVCKTITPLPAEVIEDVRGREAALAEHDRKSRERRLAKERERQTRQRARTEEQVLEAARSQQRAEEKAARAVEKARLEESYALGQAEQKSQRAACDQLRARGPRYPAVRIISWILKAVAALALVVAAIGLLQGLVADSTFGLVMAVLLSLVACYVYATGELLVVLPDIRSDTWATVQLLEELIRAGGSPRDK